MKYSVETLAVHLHIFLMVSELNDAHWFYIWERMRKITIY